MQNVLVIGMPPRESSEPAAPSDSNNEEYFTQVYHQNLEVVLRLLRGGFSYHSNKGVGTVRIRGAFDQEELCQETFRIFFDQVRRGNFDRERPVRPYLLQIARNQALKKLGKGSREVLSAEAPETLTTDQTPANAVERAEQSALLKEFRGTLSDKERQVMQACFQAKKPQRTVGEEMGLSRDQIARTVIKIRSKARSFFSKRGWFDES